MATREAGRIYHDQGIQGSLKLLSAASSHLGRHPGKSTSPVSKVGSGSALFATNSVYAIKIKALKKEKLLLMAFNREEGMWKTSQQAHGQV